MANDAELLQRYSESGSEAAFAELVERHLKLVYFTAFRRTGGDGALAQDVAQLVFATVARKAGALAHHLTLTGWLYTTTRHLADKAVRKEQTRRHYEQNAVMHELMTAEPSREWERIRPLIDDALDGLEPGDREAILIRFFEGRAFAEMGATLRISSDAARMRVDRALDKLRKKLERQGIQSASAALAVALSTQGGLAVPAGLASAVSGAAVAVASTASGAGLVFGFMGVTKTTFVAAIVAAALATGFGITERNRARAAERQLDAVNQEQVSLRARLARAETQMSRAETRAREADGDSARLLAAIEAVRVAPSTSSPAAISPASQSSPPAEDPLMRTLQAMFPNGIVATVGDKKITVEAIRREVAPLLPRLQMEARNPDELSHRLNQVQNTIVKDAVERLLLLKEFSSEGQRQIPGSYLEQAFADELKGKFADEPAQFAAYLKSRGMTKEQYRKELEEEIAYRYMKGQQRKLDKNRAQAKTQ
jgi:RNA polymerase sigma factor (sigma-70 family)